MVVVQHLVSDEQREIRLIITQLKVDGLQTVVGAKSLRVVTTKIFRNGTTLLPISFQHKA